jgi:DNA gyrase subunit A
MAIMKSGKVIRSGVAEVNRTGRNTQGVTLAKPDRGDEILSIARNEEQDEDQAAEAKDGEHTSDPLIPADVSTSAKLSDGHDL